MGHMSAPVQAVLFDLGNTLVGYYPASAFHAVLRECLQAAASAASLDLTPGEHGRLFDAALVVNAESKGDAVRSLSDRLCRLFQPYAHLDGASLDEVCRAFLAPIFGRARPDPGAPRLLDTLRQRGLKTAIVSNTPWGSPADLWRRELDRHGLTHRVDASVFCVEVGWRKPHPAPFRRALALLGVEAANALFVGDDPRWDVVGAREAGMRPVLICPDGADESECPVVRDLDELLPLIDAIR